MITHDILIKSFIYGIFVCYAIETNLSKYCRINDYSTEREPNRVNVQTFYKPRIFWSYQSSVALSDKWEHVGR